MKRLLTLLILLALLGFAVFKGAVWWLADQRLADARLALDDYGVLERGSISSGLDGHLVLTNARWQDFRLTPALEIGRLAFSAGSPVALLEALLDPSRLPAQWSLQVEGLGLVLNATLFRNWVTADGRNPDGKPALIALSCAPDPRQQLGSGDLMRMGITGLAGEAAVRQTSDALEAELSTAGTGSVEVIWPGARLNPLSWALTRESTDAPMRVTVRDGGLMRRIAAYCAREAGVEAMAWARRATSALQDGLKARGLNASDQLLALYRQWLLEGGELVLSLQPGAPWLGLPVLPSEMPAQARTWPVRYNGAEVPDVYLQQRPPEPVQTPDTGASATAEQPGLEGWYAEPLASAERWLGRQIRVTLSNDNVVEGRLVTVGDRELEVARLVGGGEVVYPILLRAVTRFEVWRRGRAQ